MFIIANRFVVLRGALQNMSCKVGVGQKSWDPGKKYDTHKLKTKRVVLSSQTKETHRPRGKEGTRVRITQKTSIFGKSFPFTFPFLC